MGDPQGLVADLGLERIVFLIFSSKFASSGQDNSSVSNVQRENLTSIEKEDIDTILFV